MRSTPPPRSTRWDSPFPRVRSRFVTALLLLTGPAYAIWIGTGGTPLLFMTGVPAPPVAVMGARPISPTPQADARAPERVVAELNAPHVPKDTAAGGTRNALADLVVLISVDGLRPDVIARHTPHIHRLQREGSWAPNARTVSKSSTLPSHASMVSGVDFQRHGLTFNAYRPARGHIQYPTIFSAAQQAGLTTALFVGKRKLKHLLNPDTESHFQVGGVYCSRVTKIALPYLISAEPGIVFLHLSDPDGAGHLHGWMGPEYLAAVQRADRCVAQIMKAVQARGQRERTLVLLTADHGGHDHDHTSDIRSDTHIPWILWGGAARPDTRIQRQVFNTDTAATILHALGLPMPAGIEGRPVLEGFGPDASGPAITPERTTR
jgi:hypothetical protein